MTAKLHFQSFKARTIAAEGRMDDRLSGLIGQVYATAAEPDRFDHVMQSVAEATESRMMLVAVATPLRILSFTTHGPLTARMADGMDDWWGDAHRFDPTFEHVQTHASQSIWASHDHFTPEEHAVHPFVRWNRHHIGSSHWTLVQASEHRGLRFGVSFHPRGATDWHSAAEHARMAALVEHMACAWRIATRPPLVEAAVDACFVVGAAGALVAASSRAEDILRSGDGLALRHGELAATDSKANARLALLIARALRLPSAGPIGGALTVPRRSNRRPYQVLVEPLPPQAGFGMYGRAATVRVVDPDGQPLPLADRLTALWRLTPAEAKFADVLLLCGCDLRASADRLGITYATARTHLARVFAKSETRSQPELMRLLTRLSGGSAPPADPRSGSERPR